MTSNLIFAYVVYFIATASPGPSNLAVIGISMSQGRRAGFVFVLGVLSGSMFWGTSAALGLSAILTRFSEVTFAIKIAGGLYLIWLAFKSARSAFATDDTLVKLEAGDSRRRGNLYQRGLLLHLSNPKAVLAWISIIALATPETNSARDAIPVILGCAVIGLFVFGGYAWLFSTDVARKYYRLARRPVEWLLSAVFGVAGVKLLASQH